MLRLPKPFIDQAIAVLFLLGSAALAVASDKPDGSHAAFGGDDLELVGIALHRETEREIFLAGLLLPPGSAGMNPLTLPAPRAMEYRIAAQRLSARGFSASVLLQAELATHRNPPQSVIGALNVINRRLKGSLKRGDQFVMFHNRLDETVFLLNGLELHRVAVPGAFNFFLEGWAGKDAAATFREPLLSGDPDAQTMRRFQELAPSLDRVAVVRGWLAIPPGAERAPALSVSARRDSEKHRQSDASVSKTVDTASREPRDAIY